jgi:hypothetical protein
MAILIWEQLDIRQEDINRDILAAFGLESLAEASRPA